MTYKRPADPTPEALAAANECATEDGAGGLHLAMPGHQIRRVALTLDAFAQAAVEKDRKKIIAFLILIGDVDASNHLRRLLGDCA